MALVFEKNLTSSRLNLSEDGLTVTANTSSWGSARLSKGVDHGRWYWEYEVLEVAGSSKKVMVGVINASQKLDTYPGQTTQGRGYFSTSGNKFLNSGSGVSYGESYGIGDIVGVALDMDMGTIEFFKNGVSQGVAYSDLHSLGTVYPTLGATISGASAKANFGAKKFHLVDADPELWNGMVFQGYKPFDEEAARYWFDKIRIRDLVFSQQYLDHEETGYILVSGTVYAIDKDKEINEHVLYSIEAIEEIESGEKMTPFNFSFAINKEDLKIGSNFVRITVQDFIGREFPFEYEIVKEGRDTFLYKRNGVHDISLPREGEVVFQADKGYVLDGMGTGAVKLEIPTEGKSNINKITLDGTPEVRETVAKTYDMELVQKKELDPMTHFKKEVSLTDLTVVIRAELRR